MKIILTEYNLEFIKESLKSPDNYSSKKSDYPKSIMIYKNICNCNDGYLCEHRLNWLINYLKSNRIL